MSRDDPAATPLHQKAKRVSLSKSSGNENKHEAFSCQDKPILKKLLKAGQKDDVDTVQEILEGENCLAADAKDRYGITVNGNHLRLAAFWIFDVIVVSVRFR